MENNKAEKKETKIVYHRGRLRELSNLLKQNICIIGISDDQERDKGAEVLCEQITSRNFSNLGKDIDIKIQDKS